ncbi:pyridoxamine 5'-phosphate oxidase family protein [Ornithinicoccus halotolerans]|uniref:pyridoxamine 5'-phosphate oxidase family protein n=1 Tax=Ornithinicoccus halotolerans TaxID=1748220 RepID=UPI001E32C902|nr:pyridoxamine 5'-phosphate oxidase family protein [Ornithinicoccus halotolerans]
MTTRSSRTTDDTSGATAAEPAELARVGRKPDRAAGDRAHLDAVLDAMLIGTLSTVVDGWPWAVPMLYARVGDGIVLHGSTGAGALRQVAAGAPACFTVARLDAMVVADTLFDHSANYRSAVVRGRLEPLHGEEHRAALLAMTERLLPGRVAEVVDVTAKELAATRSLRLPIADGGWTVKTRTGSAGEPGTDPGAWRGVVPLHERWGDPQPAPGQDPEAPVPASVAALARNR